MNVLSKELAAHYYIGQIFTEFCILADVLRLIHERYQYQISRNAIPLIILGPQNTNIAFVRKLI